MSETQDILSYLAGLVLAGKVPEGREATVAALLAAGFGEQPVMAALASLPLADPGERLRVPHARLSDEASRFLVALRDLGYLSEEMEDEALNALLVRDSGSISLADLKREVAGVLFEHQHELDSETLQLLEQEWRLAFH